MQCTAPLGADARPVSSLQKARPFRHARNAETWRRGPALLVSDAPREDRDSQPEVPAPQRGEYTITVREFAAHMKKVTYAQMDKVLSSLGSRSLRG
jgi:hypothetical protein